MTTSHHEDEVINAIYWPDAQLEGVYASYDAIEVTVTLESGQSKRLSFDGHIGMSCIGFWDESIIENVSVSKRGIFLDQCLMKIRGRHQSLQPLSGNMVRNEGTPRQFTFTLSDGCQLHIAAMAARLVEK